MSGNPYEIPNSLSEPGTGTGTDPKLLGEIKAQALTLLIVGIISIFCCRVVLAPFAFIEVQKPNA